MDQPGSSSDKGAIPKIIKEKPSNSSDIKYPLEPKPGLPCILNQSSSGVVRTRSLTSINPKLDVIFNKNESQPIKHDSSIQVIYIKSKSKSEHIKK